MELRQLEKDTGRHDPGHFVRLSVAKVGESLQGTHLPDVSLPRILVIFDESTAIPDSFYDAATSFAHRILVMANPLSTSNFFYRHCRTGDTPDPLDPKRLHRKVIHISAEDSPNVIAGKQWRKSGGVGIPPTIIPGLMSYSTYVSGRKFWDERKKRIRLGGLFDEGQEAMMFPSDRLEAAERAWVEIAGEDSATLTRREPVGTCWMGVDTASGGKDWNCWAIIDRLGIVEIDARPSTMDSPVVQAITLAKIQRYKLRHSNIAFDRGGGGTEHVGYLMRKGMTMIRRIAFSERAKDPKTYTNKRAEMYGLLRQSFDPARWSKGTNEAGMEFYETCFVLPPNERLLREELACLPLLHDAEDKMFMLPKHHKEKVLGQKEHKDGAGATCISDLIDRSPDRADALALANYCRVKPLHPAAPRVDRPDVPGREDEPVMAGVIGLQSAPGIIGPSLRPQMPAGSGSFFDRVFAQRPVKPAASSGQSPPKPRSRFDEIEDELGGYLERE